MHLRAAPALVACLLLACSPANVGGPSSAATDSGAARDSGSPVDAGTEAGADTGADGGSGSSQACSDYANARCNRLQSCSPTAILAHYGDLGTCVSRFMQSCLGAAAAPSTGQTAATLEACVGQMSSWGCSDIVFSRAPPATCLNPPGGLATGTACAVGQQCQTAYCAVVPGAGCGVCAAAPKAGDSCAQLSSCGFSLTCNSANTCVPFADAGGTCSATLPCAAGLACQQGTCQQSVTTLGASCVSNGTGCDFWGGLACNSLSQHCVPVVLASGGDQCGYVNLQNTGCRDGLCTGIVGDMPGTCSQYGGIGDSCNVASGPFCYLPLHCIVTGDGGTSGTCLIPDATTCR